MEASNFNTFTKPGKKASNITSYGPIALTNCLSKIFKKMIVERLTYYLEMKSILQPYQSGFRGGHSTYVIVRLKSDIREAFIRDEYVIAVFLDIENSFDSVWHHGLLQKIHEHGLRGHLPFFIRSFLTGRQVKVIIGTTYSRSSSLACVVVWHMPHGIFFHPLYFPNFVHNKFFFPFY